MATATLRGEPDGNMTAVVRQPDHTAFNFKDWAKKSKLNEGTINYLQEQELVEENDLRLLKEETVKTLPLTLGQRNRLNAGLKQLQLEKTGDSQQSAKPVLSDIDPDRHQTMIVKPAKDGQRMQADQPDQPHPLQPLSGTEDFLAEQPALPVETSVSGHQTVTGQQLGDTRQDETSVVQADQVDKPRLSACGPPEDFDGALRSLLERLGLTEYYPKKIRLQDVQDRWSRQAETEADLPWVILRQILMGDHRARDFEVHSINTKQTPASVVSSSSLLGFALDHDQQNTKKRLHPSDVIVCILACCDLILRQTACQKMFLCKLSIPFALPTESESSEMMLWALRTIVLEWQESQDKAVETSVVSAPVRFVSCVNFGDLRFSKSIFLNHVMRSKSETFFNKSCPAGKVMRSLTNGLIEMSWYVPNKDTELMQTAFLNLRGKVQNNIQALNVLANISDTMLVVTSFTNLSETEDREFLERIIKNNKQAIVLLLLDGQPFNIAQAIYGKLNAMAETYRSQLIFLPGFEINPDTNLHEDYNPEELAKKAIDKLSTLFADPPQNSLVSLTQNVREFHISIDEADVICQKAAAECQTLMADWEQQSSSKIKSTLELQGDLWSEWVKHMKAATKPSSSSRTQEGLLREQDDLSTKKDKIRQRQMSTFSKSSTFMHSFLQIIKGLGETERELFLQFLKLHLDDRSRQCLPDIFSNYCTIWNDIKRNHDQPEKRQQYLQDQLQNAEKELVSASLGVEHVFRELCQVHEAAVACKQKLPYLNLPKFVAQRIIEGHPFEIMDGDVACVPITWIKDVFRELNKVISSKKMLVLSVLGVQSSGKSTLLNAMFGLEFAVSAGRCTRGIFAQLVSPGDPKYPFDYLLVVDTEGLRAPELQDDNFDHDNELATLVLGLGDVTIINVKGENTAEVSNVLQIAVHAFLKLKVANRCRDLHRQCIFVHQNVSAVTARQKMRLSQNKLVDKLDEMTKEAAKLENIRDIVTFNHLLKFDADKNIWFVPDLWEGEPPMAPVNTKYVEKVHKIRDSVLDAMADNNKMLYNVSDIFSRLRDLWSGICSMDFVFSFRNTLEAKGYDILERKYREAIWGVEKGLSEWYLTTGKPRLIACCSPEELNSCYRKLVGELQSKASEQSSTVHEWLHRFINEHDLKQVMTQWEEAKKRHLPLAITDTEDYINLLLREDKEIQRVDIANQNHESKVVKHIMSNAERLALEHSNTDEDSLCRHFREFWKTQALTELPKPVDNKDYHIQQEFMNHLHESFQADKHLLKHALHKMNFAHVSVQSTNLSFGELHPSHLQISKRFWQTLWPKGSNKIPTQAIAETDNILKEMKLYISQKCSAGKAFRREVAREIHQKLISLIESVNNASLGFTFLHTFAVDISVVCSLHAIKMFQEQQHAYENKFGLTARLRELEERSRNLFINTARKKSNELVAAEYICSVLGEAVKVAVETVLPVEIQSDILSHFCHQKYHLITTILGDLADSENFDDFQSYLQSPATFAKEWLITYVNNRIFDKSSSSSRYFDIARSRIEGLVSKSVRASEHATDTMTNPGTGTDLSVWLSYFWSEIDDCVSSNNDMSFIASKEIQDFRSFHQEIVKQLHNVKTVLLSSFERQDQSDIQWRGEPPYGRIFTKLWGCEAHCPFCREPCQDSDPYHYRDGDGQPHRAMQHKHDGLAGFRWRGSKKMSTDMCTVSVTTDTMYSCGGVCVKYGTCKGGHPGEFRHKFRDYKSIFPSWDIPPDTSTDSATFWNWVFAKYNKRLSQQREVKMADIPRSWNKISKQEAKDSLRKLYNMD